MNNLSKNLLQKTLKKLNSYFFIFLCAMLFLTLFSFQKTQAQNFSLKATFIENTNEPLAFATISLWRIGEKAGKKDSTLTKFLVTNEKGEVTFENIAPNNYRLKAEMSGFANFISPMINLDKDTDLGKITLKNDGEMEAVEIKAKRPIVEIQPDKTVFNVENLISATGSTAFELLQKSPGVVIDNNDNINLQGKPAMRVYIDGRPSPLTGKDLADYLRTVQGVDIEAIELITQPSAKYDASGNAGIINIRFKKNKNLGSNGSFTLGVGHGKFTRYNGSVTLNNRTAKASYFINYSPRIAKEYNFIDLDRSQNSSRFNQTSNTASEANAHNLRAGADFFLDKKNTLGFGITGNFADVYALTNSNTDISGNNPTFNNLKAENTTKAQRFSSNFNTNYRYADTSGRSLNIDANVGFFKNDRDFLQPNTYSGNQLFARINYRMVTPTNIILGNIKADWEQRLGKGKLGFGAKIAFVNTDNNFGFYNINPNNNAETIDNERSNLFTYLENVNALYVNYQIKIKKFDFQLGVRAEQTNSKGTLTAKQINENAEVKREYLDFFPSAGVSYNANQKNVFGLRYSRRIERPNYQDLNPFESRLDELTYQKGNPFLKPQYTQSLELSHNYAYTLNTSLSYSNTTGFFAQVTDTLNVTKSVMSTQNFGNLQVWNLGITYPMEIRKWWNMFISINASHSDYYADFGGGRVINRQIQSLNFYGQQTFSLPKNFTLEFSGFWTSPSIWAGVYRTQSLGNLDIALQKKVFGESGTLKLTVTDVFFTLPWRAVNEFAGLYINGNGGSDSRQIRVNFTYRFGNKQVKGLKQRKTGAEEEMQRIGN